MYLSYVSFGKAFSDNVDFTEIKVYSLQHPVSSLPTGEANFQLCCFKGDTLFTRAEFSTCLLLWRTLFRSEASFAR
jgi:hypothetical protein